MKVLFLDIDGVALTYPIKRKNHRKLSPELVTRLKRVVEKSGASIVVTSAWRKTQGFPGNLRRAFKKAGWLHPPIIGWTGSSGSRGEEILHWLSINKADSYVVLDDEIFDLRPPLKNIVQTNRFIGISERDVEKIFEIWKLT